MTVAVALSGGADSLMSLLALRQSGHKVLGVYARLLSNDDQHLVAGLAALCASLDTPLHVLDLRRDFERLVIVPFLHAYQRGLTPNPCATCNPALKFGLLLDQALALGADKMATGHYAGLDPDGPCLFRGQDQSRDQSYFLSRVPRERLRHVLFPLAGWTKKQVLAELERLGLTPPAGGESREICFIADDYREFLRSGQVALSGPGPIALADGTVLGRHEGLWNHTLGQRKGLGVAWSEPLYVIAKDRAANCLIVGPKDQTLATDFRTGPPNVLAEPRTWPAQPLVQTIFRQQPVAARVYLGEQGMNIVFATPQPRPAPGQIAAVFAPDGQVLAGAEIVEDAHAT